MLESVISYIVQTIGSLGYIGIFFMMFLESSFFPFPSEVVMIPAGFLAFKGDMNLFVAILSGILGSLFGALFNYYLSLKFGRIFISKYGKYVFINEVTLLKMEKFFDKHGHISTFSGRLLPAVRQYISLPAGLARMNIFKFSFYTSLGATLWVTILALLGYFIGSNQELIDEYLKIIIILIIVFLFVGIVFYVKRKKCE